MKKEYVLLTTARNEEKYIEKTIQAVIKQSILPKKWLIIIDNSIDKTDKIVTEYASRNKFIDYLYFTSLEQRSFESKANAIRIGYEKLKNEEFDFIGNLDADITFDPYYYENVLNKFDEYPKLGIAGGMIWEKQGGKFKKLNYSLNSVAGAIQLFRRDCFEIIGGYIPLKRGGIDAVAEIMSRMQGWHVRSFFELKVFHHRKIGSTTGKFFYSKFRFGLRDYSIGTHPLFMLFKCINRFRERPYIICGTFMLLGYLWSWIRREPSNVPDKVIKYLRQEQKQKIISAVFNLH